MTDRERLVKILCEGECQGEENQLTCPERRNGQCKSIRKLEMCQVNSLADTILADGWIRPPCKVGDTVYFDKTGYHDSAEIDGIHIDENGIAFSWVQYDVGVDITELWDEGEFDIEEIGKTVFLTEEEAEKARAEREGKD